MIRKFLLIAALATVAVTGAACKTFDTVGSVISAANAAEVPVEAVAIATNSFNLAQVTAAQYLRLPRGNLVRVGNDVGLDCGTKVLCRDPRATQPIKKAIFAGRNARDKMQLFLRRNPGKLGPGGLYDALTTATGTLKDLFLTYGVKS